MGGGSHRNSECKGLEDECDLVSCKENDYAMHSSEFSLGLLV